MKRKQRQSNSGFTLIEVLVAIIILSIGLLAVAAMQATSIRSNDFAQRLTVITAVAQGTLEDLMARNTSDPIFDTAAVDVPYENRTVQGVIYNSSYSITPDTPVSDVAMVVMTVTGGGRTLSLTSYKRSL
jgi:type IV pilus assembly protein PilV